MEKYTCPKCNKTTYTAYRDIAHACPYCNTQKMLIFSPKAFSLGFDMSEVRLVFDRRTNDVDMELERREQKGVQCIPIAWLVIKENVPEAENV